MYPDRRANKSWNHDLEEAKWRKKDKTKKLERKLQQFIFQEKFIRETMVLGLDDKHDTMLKQIQKEKEKLMYDLKIYRCTFFLWIFYFSDLI